MLGLVILADFLLAQIVLVLIWSEPRPYLGPGYWLSPTCRRDHRLFRQSTGLPLAVTDQDFRY